MAKYLGPVCRICRREKTKLFLKGSKCLMSKCPVEKGRKPPGEQRRRRRKVSEYGLQLREKQKIKRIYGILEKQFSRYFEEAEHHPGVTGDLLLQMLETRLDNVVFVLGFTHSLRHARQFVRHGHVLINGRRVDYPGCRVKTGDVIEVRDRRTSRQRAAEALEATRSREVPGWLKLDKNRFRGEVLSLPKLGEISIPVDVSQVVALYTRQ